MLWLFTLLAISTLFFMIRLLIRLFRIKILCLFLLFCSFGILMHISNFMLFCIVMLVLFCFTFLTLLLILYFIPILAWLNVLMFFIFFRRISNWIIVIFFILTGSSLSRLSALTSTFCSDKVLSAFLSFLQSTRFLVLGGLSTIFTVNWMLGGELAHELEK